MVSRRERLGKHAKPPLRPNEAAVVMTVKVPATVRVRADAAAQAAGVSRSEWLRAVVEQALEES